MESKNHINKLIYRIGQNTILQIIGKGLSVLLSVLTVYILTRYLGVEQYGNYVLIFTFLSFLGVFSDFGLHLTVVKEISTRPGDIKLINSTYFWIKVLLSSVSVLISIFGLPFFPYPAELKLGIIIGSLALSIGNLSSYNNALFQSKLRLELISIVDLISKVVTVITLLIFVSLKLSIPFLVLAVLVGNSIGLISSWVIGRKMFALRSGFDSKLAISIIKTSFPIGLVSLLSLFYFKIDSILISLIRNSNELGYYGFSYKIFENLLMLWGFYMASVFPLLSKYYKVKSSVFELLLKKSIYIALLSSLILIFLSLGFSKNLILALGGESFLQSNTSLLILISSSPLFFINNILFHVFLIKNLLKIMIQLMLTSLFFNIIINLIIIPKFGYIGASVTTLITESFLLIGYIWFLTIKRPIKIN